PPVRAIILAELPMPTREMKPFVASRMATAPCLWVAGLLAACGTRTPRTAIEDLRLRFPRQAGAVLGDGTAGFEIVGAGFARTGEASNPQKTASALASGGVTARFPRDGAGAIQFSGAGLSAEVFESDAFGEGD